MRAEELLAALEQGGEQSETVRHIKEINSHLKLLAMEATATGHTHVIARQLPQSGKPAMKPGRVGLASNTQRTPTTSPLVSAQHRHQVARSHSYPSSIPFAVVEIPKQQDSATQQYSTTQTPPTNTQGTSAERSQQPATFDQPRPRRKPRPRRSQSLTEGINVQHLYPQSPPQQYPLRAAVFTGFCEGVATLPRSQPFQQSTKIHVNEEHQPFCQLPDSHLPSYHLPQAGPHLRIPRSPAAFTSPIRTHEHKLFSPSEESCSESEVTKLA